mmetsp:Transcript_9765/g.24035  ORF Transcript_9765/g.24035 Transcript_9765/m.24035 type:complete len:90 (+) Transcript_9765:584-853(+)
MQQINSHFCVLPQHWGNFVKKLHQQQQQAVGRLRSALFGKFTSNGMSTRDRLGSSMPSCFFSLAYIVIDKKSMKVVESTELILLLECNC